MTSSRPRGPLRTIVVLGLTGLLMAGLAAPAMAAASLTATGLAATVSGSTVSLTTTITSSSSITAAFAGICVRDADGNNDDLHSTSLSIGTSGVTVSKSATFDAGTYTYWSCAKIGGSWNDIGSAKTFTVGTVASAVASTPSGQRMPVGDIGNFDQVFTDDFTTNLSRGSFPGSYASKWASYDGFGDTLGGGVYNQDIISMSGGVMDLYLHKENGKGQVAAPVPKINGDWNSQVYGKYTVRFKSDALPGYRTAWLLWPESDKWAEGEIDFPEGGLAGEMWGFNHCVGNPAVNCGWVDTNTTYTSWHTVSVEWTPAGVTMILDGKTVMKSTNAIPKKNLRWILQTESGTSNTAKMTKDGHLQIDWVTIYDYKG